MNKSIVLKSLDLKNFKGIKELHIDFSSTVTNIYGENATGKTSIFDAFTWLLFDKDSHNRTKFDVQPLDENNNIKHMLDTEVSAVIGIDGINTVLKKILREKWVTPKGKPNAEIKGVESTYYIDEVPKKQTEYKKFINELTTEDIFKLLTNPMYFSINLKWQDQKKILMELIEEFTDEAVINYKETLKPLKDLLGNKNIEEFKKSISSTKKKLIKDKESIPSRVDEVYKKIKDDIDFDALEFRKSVAVGEMKDADEQLLDRSKVNDAIFVQKDKLYSLKDKLRDIEYQAKLKAEEPKKQLQNSIYDIQDKKSKIDREVKLIDMNIDSKKKSVEDLQNEMNRLRAEYKKVASKQFEFPENETICPLCKRPFNEEHIEETRKTLEENFNINNAEMLKRINENGKNMKSKVEIINKEIDDLMDKSMILTANGIEITADLNDAEKKYNDFKPEINLESNEEYQELKTKIEQLELKLSKPKELNNQVNDLNERKRILQQELEDINNQLFYREQNKEFEIRVEELKDQERDLAQRIADIENQEFLCDDFIKTKVELLESSINSKFRYVNFKFFKRLTNGGIEECCDALINGVPFSNANTASQINAGLDIINTLCRHYGFNAPVFIDNRESVNDIIDTDSQIVNLVVSNDKKLKVSNTESEVA